MAIIKEGSIRHFSVEAPKVLRMQMPHLNIVNKFSLLEQISSNVSDEKFDYLESEDQRGVGLKAIKLTKGFEGLLKDLFNKQNEVYFLAWCWDLSGKPIYIYPGTAEEIGKLIIPMTKNDVREFIGQGINLFPKRKVKGGIAVRIQIWESDHKARENGRILEEVTNAINQSELNNLLTLTLAGGVSAGTIPAITTAAFALSQIIAKILKANSDDYVDFFEGYYAADQPWVVGEELIHGLNSEIILNKY